MLVPVHLVYHSRCFSQRLVKFWFGKEVKGLEGKSKAGKVALYFLRLLLTNTLIWKGQVTVWLQLGACAKPSKDILTVLPEHSSSLLTNVRALGHFPCLNRRNHYSFSKVNDINRKMNLSPSISKARKCLWYWRKIFYMFCHAFSHYVFGSHSWKNEEKTFLTLFLNS